MKKILILVLLLIGSCNTIPPTPNDINIRSGVPIIQVTINGITTWALLDTGASKSIISPKLAVGVSSSLGNVSGIGGNISSEIVSTHISIIGVQFTTETFIQELPVLKIISNAANKEVLAIIGYNDIKNNNFYINTKENKLFILP